MIFNKLKSKGSSSKSKRDFIAKILSVIAALALWFYVVDVQNVVEEKTIYNVPVEVEQLDSTTGMTVVSGMDYSIDVVVRGSKNDLKNLTNRNISARVEKADYSTIGDNWCDIRIKTPDNVSVVSRSVQNINVSVDNLHEKTFEIDAVPVQYKLAPGFIIDEVVPKSSVVTVSGPESLINNVKGAQIRVIRDDVIDNNISDSSEKVILVDENNNIINDSYLIVTPEYVGYEIHVAETKTLKNVDVSILKADVVSDEYYFEFAEENIIDFVNVLCKKELVGNITESDISAFVDVSEIDSVGKHTLNVEFDLPDGVSLADHSEFSIDVMSYAIENKTFLVNVFDTDGELPDFNYHLDDKFVSVSGPENSLDEVSTAAVYVDLSKMDKNFVVEAEVKLFDEDKKVINDTKLDLDKSTVKVNVTLVQDVDFSSEDAADAATQIKNLADLSLGFFSDDSSNLEFDLLVS